MGRDSNPRYPYGYGSFQDCCLKPLGHPSKADSASRRRLAAPAGPFKYTDRRGGRKVRSGKGKRRLARWWSGANASENLAGVGGHWPPNSTAISVSPERVGFQEDFGNSV